MGARLSSWRRAAAVVALGAAVLALGPGCGARPETRATGLLDTLRKYHEHLRWENYGGAAALVDAPLRPAWKQAILGYGRISDYELGDVDLKDPPGTDAEVLVRFTVFRLPDLTVRTSVLQEHWHRDGDKWHLTGQAEPAAGF